MTVDLHTPSQCDPWMTHSVSHLQDLCNPYPLHYFFYISLSLAGKFWWVYCIATKHEAREKLFGLQSRLTPLVPRSPTRFSGVRCHKEQPPTAFLLSFESKKRWPPGVQNARHLVNDLQKSCLVVEQLAMPLYLEIPATSILQLKIHQ